ncbi:unnamed protein product [Caenorhabditis auriculariae]|uniref:Coiled-coil domain-containing protein 12 n=1 Tax=Caenorhabditis auriculariae TaxID=2777116 RepID=A0A8S1H858_9PELO|nr:unnamed protein product [Caenorhabditis auriculariae]
MREDEENSNTSDDDVEAITRKETSLESAAKARKRRLMALKSQIHGIPMQEQDYETKESDTKKSKEGLKQFRNHKPVYANVGNVTNGTDLDVVENEIVDHLQDVVDEKPIENVDLSMLAPKKIDWDLKRDIEAKLQKLDRKTQRAVAEIIRHRLAQGKGDLVSTVNAGTA